MELTTNRYNSNYAASLKKLGGTWSASKKCWIVPDECNAAAQKVHDKWFGGERCMLKITALSTIENWKSSVDFAGFTVAYAFDRDSGAKLGADVVFVSGKMSSGGSRINWKTIVNKDSEFIMLDFPRAVVPKLRSQYWTWEIVDSVPAEDDDEIKG